MQRSRLHNSYILHTTYYSRLHTFFRYPYRKALWSMLIFLQEKILQKAKVKKMTKIDKN